jgi:hypothetical protein
MEVSSMSQTQGAVQLLELIVGLIGMQVCFVYTAIKHLVMLVVRCVAPASEPLDLATVEAVNGFAGLIHQDPAAYDAARQAAWDAGDYHYHPIKFLNRFTFLYSDDPPHQRSRLEEEARRRFETGIARRAWEGSLAYVQGRRGNAYTRFLIDRFGRVSPRPKASAASPAHHEGAGAVPWWGSGQGDRFGPKQFSVVAVSGL